MIQKLLSLFFSLVFMITGLSFQPLYETQLQMLEKEQTSIQEEIKKQEEIIAKTDESNLYVYVNELNVQVSNYNNSIDNIDAQAELINKEIEKLENEIQKIIEKQESINNQITKTETELYEVRDKILLRIRANYMAGPTSVLEIFLSSKKDIAAFLNAKELYQRIQKSDTEMLENLNNKIEELENLQSDLNTEIKNYNTKKAEVKEKEEQVNKLKALIETEMTELLKKSNEANEKLYETGYYNKALFISEDDYNNEIESGFNNVSQVIKNQNIFSFSLNAYTTGWTWPVPYQSAYISSPYGYRSDPATGVTKFHSGIDISMAGAEGKNIIASKSGIVTSVIFSNTGYGNHLIVDHGNGWSSLYAHCSNICVSEGEYVKKGQVIAKIGSSGYSTGPHLHFEIRNQEEKLNPLNYVHK